MATWLKVLIGIAFGLYVLALAGLPAAQDAAAVLHLPATWPALVVVVQAGYLEGRRLVDSVPLVFVAFVPVVLVAALARK